MRCAKLPGMARPPKDPAVRLRPVTIHLDRPSIELLDRHSAARGLSRGGLVASVLRRLTFPALNAAESAPNATESGKSTRNEPK